MTRYDMTMVIKENLKKSELGYELNGRVYGDYYKNECFEAFKKEMPI